MDRVNELVANGMAFRDAYQEISRQIRKGEFQPGLKFTHTHQGSMGNLCLEEIERKMEDRRKAFDFEKHERALRALVEEK